MIKIILPDKKKYSFEYNLDATIKDILNKFCQKKGLLPDMYEVYDPDKGTIFDLNKTQRFYNLKLLHLRRVNTTKGSADEGIESTTAKNHLSPCIPNTDASPISYYTSKSSLESPNVLEEKKPKKMFFWSKSTKENISIKPSLNGMNVRSPTKTSDTTRSKIKVDGGKKKRQAPSPPNGFPDIPSPPPMHNFTDNQSLPLFIDKSSVTDEYSDNDEYSTICDANVNSLSDRPFPANKTKNIETPICTSSNCLRKTDNNLNDKDTSRRCSLMNNIHSPVSRHSFNNDNVSDPEDHVYSIINKTSQNGKEPVTKTSTNMVNNDQKENISDDKEADLIPMPVSEMKDITTLPSFNFPTYTDTLDGCNREIITAQSPDSDIDTPEIPYQKIKKNKGSDTSKTKTKLLTIKSEEKIREKSKHTVTARNSQIEIKTISNEIEGIVDEKSKTAAMHETSGGNKDIEQTDIKPAKHKFKVHKITDPQQSMVFASKFQEEPKNNRKKPPVPVKNSKKELSIPSIKVQEVVQEEIAFTENIPELNKDTTSEDSMVINVEQQEMIPESKTHTVTVRSLSNNPNKNTNPNDKERVTSLPPDRDLYKLSRKNDKSPQPKIMFFPAQSSK